VLRNKQIGFGLPDEKIPIIVFINKLDREGKKKTPSVDGRSRKKLGL
jgi:peptide subunit release factor RF-3